MTGLDTNVIVRYIMLDDALQSGVAIRLFDSFTTESPGYLSLICLAELNWLLDHTYKLSRTQIQQAIDSILTTETLVVEDPQLVGRAFYAFRNGNANFDDCLIAECSSSAGCDGIMTFDKRAAQSAGMTLLL
jgi:predicted nucleic-acid-binding protein